MAFGGFDGDLVSRVGVAHNSHTGIRGQHAREASSSFRRSIGDDNLTRVLAISHPYAAAMMEGNPSSTANRVDHCIKDRPIGDCIRTILHRFGFAVWRSDRPRIQMIAPDHDWRFDFSTCNEFIEFEASLEAFAKPQPADARWQSLERDFFARHL